VQCFLASWRWLVWTYSSVVLFSCVSSSENQWWPVKLVLKIRTHYYYRLPRTIIIIIIINTLQCNSIDGLSVTCADNQKIYLITNNNYITEKLLDCKQLVHLKQKWYVHGMSDEFFFLFPGCMPLLPPPALAVKCWTAGATEQITQGCQGNPLSRPDQHLMKVDDLWSCKHIIADLNKQSTSKWTNSDCSLLSTSQPAWKQASKKQQLYAVGPMPPVVKTSMVKNMLSPLPWCIHHMSDISFVHELRSTWTVGNENRSAQID